MAPDTPEREPEMLQYAAEANIQITVSADRHSRSFY